MKKSKWEQQAEEARVQLAKAQVAHSRAGMYLTSLLLGEVLRVSEYEKATEIARYRESRKRKK